MKTTANSEAVERRRKAMLHFEEAYKQATAAGVDLSMPPGSGAFTCAGKSAEEQATEIEEAARELEEATEKAIFDKARNDEEDAEVKRYYERGSRKTQGQHCRKIKALREENEALRLKLSEAERDKARLLYILDQQGK